MGLRSFILSFSSSSPLPYFRNQNFSHTLLPSPIQPTTNWSNSVHLDESHNFLPIARLIPSQLPAPYHCHRRIFRPTNPPSAVCSRYLASPLVAASSSVPTLSSRPGYTAATARKNPWYLVSPTATTITTTNSSLARYSLVPCACPAAPPLNSYWQRHLVQQHHPPVSCQGLVLLGFDGRPKRQPQRTHFPVCKSLLFCFIASFYCLLRASSFSSLMLCLPLHPLAWLDSCFCDSCRVANITSSSHLIPSTQTTAANATDRRPLASIASRILLHLLRHLGLILPRQLAALDPSTSSLQTTSPSYQCGLPSNQTPSLQYITLISPFSSSPCPPPPPPSHPTLLQTTLIHAIFSLAFPSPWSNPPSADIGYLACQLAPSPVFAIFPALILRGSTGPARLPVLPWSLKQP